MAAIARCEMCTDDETRFRVPWDETGVALMREHLKDTHGYEAPTTRPRFPQEEL